MAKLSFRYGSMGSCKTANILMIKYNFEEKGKKAILLKPKCETRDGAHKLKSRIGLEAECMFVEDYLENPIKCDCILVDEAQFLTPEQVDKLSDFVDFNNTPVICFGLKTDFQSNLFIGSKRLLEVCDEIEEITTICWCGKKARFNARIQDGKIVKDGNWFFLGGNESYVPLCRRHYKLGLLGEE